MDTISRSFARPSATRTLKLSSMDEGMLRGDGSWVVTIRCTLNSRPVRRMSWISESKSQALPYRCLTSVRILPKSSSTSNSGGHRKGVRSPAFLREMASDCRARNSSATILTIRTCSAA